MNVKERTDEDEEERDVADKRELNEQVQGLRASSCFLS